MRMKSKHFIALHLRLVAFNLGYLPGGDKTIITESETTLKALEVAKSIVVPGGLISLRVYVGHLDGWQATLTRYKVNINHFQGKVLPSVRVSDPGLLLKPDEPNLDGKTLDNELEVVEGMKLDRGYISPYFITNQNNQKCELENPLIIIHEKKISSINDVVKVLELVLQL
ncbi:hypothetical protein L3X38_025636 [Prunus dulcis]|uniref:Uncharacterized protein n=1 Tax=Prunus dulcis TaxID=3755 RepID=A0AAD4W381_PRUDU|nr:hypothetical protein L3X38_025636 [Prunus dulcis]